MTPAQKIACAGALFAVWGVFVAAGVASASEFVTAIRDALVGLGVFTATAFSLPKD